MGFLRKPIAVSREVSLTSEGFPSRASTNRAATRTLFLAKYIPAAATVIPVTYKQQREINCTSIVLQLVQTFCTSSHTQGRSINISEYPHKIETLRVTKSYTET